MVEYFFVREIRNIANKKNFSTMLLKVEARRQIAQEIKKVNTQQDGKISFVGALLAKKKIIFFSFFDVFILVVVIVKCVTESKKARPYVYRNVVKRINFFFLEEEVKRIFFFAGLFKGTI